MAIVKGDIVTIPLISATLPTGTFGPVFTPQPIKIGVVDNAPGDMDVLWQDSGLLQTAIDPASLDIVKPADAADITEFQGKYVRVAETTSQGWSPEYQGLVTALYKRDNAGAGVLTGSYALVRTPSGQYIELLCSQLEVVAGR